MEFGVGGTWESNRQSKDKAWRVLQNQFTNRKISPTTESFRVESIVNALIYIFTPWRYFD